MCKKYGDVEHTTWDRVNFLTKRVSKKVGHNTYDKIDGRCQSFCDLQYEAIELNILTDILENVGRKHS